MTMTKGHPGGHHVHAVPMLSPVLEDFVPLPFRGNVPDDVAKSPTTAAAAITGDAPVAVTATETATATEVPADWFKQRRVPVESRFKEQQMAPVESESKASTTEAKSEVDLEDNGIRSRVSLMLNHWRKRAERGPVQVPVQKPVQVQGLSRQKSTRPRRSVVHYLNPYSLLAKLRDTYVHLMNGVATSGIVASGPVGDSSAQQSTLFFSREIDAQYAAQIRDLERSGSQADAEYRQLQNMAFARSSSRVKPFGEPGVNYRRETELPRSKSTRSYVDLAFFSTSRSGRSSGRRLSGELPRSKSNGLSDEVFFSRKLKGSRKNKPHINPYADSDWKADAVPREPKAVSKIADPNDFHFQRQKMNAGTESRTEYRLQQSASTGSLFRYRH